MMHKLDIETIYDRLVKLTYTGKYYQGGTYDFHVVNTEARDIFRSELVAALNESLNEYEAKISRLEAKVYAYEAILANSNFAMAVINDDCGSQGSCNNPISIEDVFRLVAGHSIYSGDSILSAFTCLSEGRDVKDITPLDISYEEIADLRREDSENG